MCLQFLKNLFHPQKHFLHFFKNLFRSKKNVIHQPRVSEFKLNYACDDPSLEWHVKAYLSRNISAKKCLQSFIENMAYDENKRIKDNEIIFDILDDFLKNATWKTEWTIDCGDYNPSRPEPWLRCIYSIYSEKIFFMKEAEEFLKENGKDITSKNIAAATVHWGMSVSEEEYLHKEDFVQKENQLRTIIESGDFTPYQALKMIKENWDYLYRYQSTYEAIEYCIAASENHTTSKYFDAAFRDLGHKLGTLYFKAKEK